MIKALRICAALTLSLFLHSAWADARVFALHNPDTQQVLESLQKQYGDKLHAELVQEKLVVIGSKQQLDEIASALTRLDPAPIALRLHLREQPPEDARPNVITYSSNSTGYALDTIEGALIAVDYQQFAQQVDSAAVDGDGGWWVTLNSTPTLVHSMTLQVRVQNKRVATVVVSYTKEENQERHTYGNTVSGYLGSWIALLPQPDPDAAGTISSGAKPGSQLYLRIDKLIAPTKNSVNQQ
jgi:hypothetical protein